MTRTLPLWVGTAILLGALACETEPPSPDDDSAPRVVFRGSSAETVSPPSESAIHGRELGPRDGAPEVVVLGDPAPKQPARERTIREPAPGPEVIYETVYVDAEAPAPSNEPAPPEPVAATDPVPEPESDPAPEPEPSPEPVATGQTTDDGPVWTTGRAPTPDRSPNRTEDAIVGAAIGAGIGAVLGGRDGAVRGGIGGAVGGAVGGRTGAVLGGVLGGAGGRRGGARPRGGGCWAPRTDGRSPTFDRSPLEADVRLISR